MKSNKEEASAKLAELVDHIRTRYSFGYRPSIEQPLREILQNQVDRCTQS